MRIKFKQLVPIEDIKQFFKSLTLKKMITELRHHHMIVILAIVIALFRPAMELPEVTEKAEHFVLDLLNLQTSKKGIDVSHYDGKIEWQKTLNHVDFVFVKATEGITYTDPRYHENASALQNVEQAIGAYHF
mgnify:CR=1 FL=1